MAATMVQSERELLDVRLQQLHAELAKAEQQQMEQSLTFRVRRDLEATQEALARLDEIESRQAAEAAKQERQRLFAAAELELDATRAILHELEAQYRALPDRITRAQAQFSAALHDYASKKAALEAL